MTLQDVLSASPGVIAVLGAALAMTLAARPAVAVQGSLIAQKVTFGVTALLALLVLIGGSVGGELFAIDRLTAIIALLTAGISLTVQTYAKRYMDGDAAIARFFRDMSLMAAAILFMVTAANMLVFAVGWVAASLPLASLIAHRRDWPPASAAAKRTLRALMIGDVALIGAALLAVIAFGTANLAEIEAAATARAGEGVVVLFALLLVAAAIAKSAQLPLAGWLADTMTAPTPVSALMHAGFVNAGGYLLARFADLFIAQPALLAFVFAIGAATALLGSLAMIVQTDIKRALAWSTVGQMGFMIMQCGVGAFAAAIYHVVAHGIFKATLFLGAGSVVPEARDLNNAPAARVDRRLAGTTAAIVVVFTLAIALVPVSVVTTPGLLLTTFALMAALHALLVWNRHPQGAPIGFTPGLVAVIAGVGLYLVGTGATGLLLGASVPAAPASLPVLYAVVPALFATVLLVSWTGLPARLRPLGDRLYLRLLMLGHRPADAQDTFSHRLPAR